MKNIFFVLHEITLQFVPFFKHIFAYFFFLKRKSLFLHVHNPYHFCVIVSSKYFFAIAMYARIFRIWFVCITRGFFFFLTSCKFFIKMKTQTILWDFNISFLDYSGTKTERNDEFVCSLANSQKKKTKKTRT